MTDARAKPRILAVTPGDPAGIGPEIVWKTLRDRAYPHRDTRLLVVGARAPFERLGARIVEADPEALGRGELPRLPREPHVWLLPAPARPPVRGLHREGFQSGWSIGRAVELIRRGVATGLVTGPISKERLQRGGYDYPGHTEFLADLCGVRQVTMMLANDQLRVTLATTHVALRDVARRLTKAGLERTILHTVEHLRSWWGIARPRVAVAALNPHAGEGGLFGNEDQRLIAPLVRTLNARARGRFRLEGPLPADTLFARHVLTPPAERHDAVVCMYHDQGLVPVKLLDFPRTVNVTLGLPIVRTSVDHGTGFDIAFTGRADPSSFQSAVRLARQLTR
jgi:4-hydroxythreonine-4-phosphate dehydrogenase